MTSECTELAVYRRTPASSFGEWMIRATQIRCRPPPGESEGDGGGFDGLGGLVQGDGNRAPPGCLQWFFGAAQGEVKTFNFDGGAHLADQRHSICVRWAHFVPHLHCVSILPPSAGARPTPAPSAGSRATRPPTLPSPAPA